MGKAFGRFQIGISAVRVWESFAVRIKYYYVENITFMKFT